MYWPLEVCAVLYCVELYFLKNLLLPSGAKWYGKAFDDIVDDVLMYVTQYKNSGGKQSFVCDCSKMATYYMILKKNLN